MVDISIDGKQTNREREISAKQVSLHYVNSSTIIMMKGKTLVVSVIAAMALFSTEFTSTIWRAHVQGIQALLKSILGRILESAARTQNLGAIPDTYHTYGITILCPEKCICCHLHWPSNITANIQKFSTNVNWNIIGKK